MNKVCINGRLTAEPVLRNLENNNAVCTLFIANNVYFGQSQKANFLKVTAWGNQGRTIAQYARKGTELYITGRLEQRSYKNGAGATVYDVSIVVEHFDFGSKPSVATHNE